MHEHMQFKSEINLVFYPVVKRTSSTFKNRDANMNNMAFLTKVPEEVAFNS